MKALLATIGSRGDVQPMVALGVALREAGHEVLLAGPPAFAPLARRHGMTFAAIGGGLADLANGVGGDGGSSLGVWQGFRKALHTAATETLQATLALGRDADVVVASGQNFLSASVAEKLGVPYWYAALSPVGIKSAQYPPVLGVQLGLPGWTNRLAWVASERAADSAFRAALNAARASVELGPVKGVLEHTIYGSHARVVAGFSEHLFPAAADWRPGTVQTGALSVEGTDGDPILEAWLAEGEAPIYLGFGSMAEREPLEMLRAALAAGRAADVRLVLGGEWGSLGKGSGPNVYFAREVDHEWLFPRVAAVVHHGGAGTSAAALRAGKPSVVVPHIGDQFLWGRRLHEEGVAIRLIPRPLLTAQTLTRALIEVRAEGLKERAAALGEQVRAEGGARAAAAAIAGIDRLGRQGRRLHQEDAATAPICGAS